VAENAAAIPSGSLLEIDAGGSLVLGMTGSAYIEGFGGMAGSPLGSQPSGAPQAGAPAHATPEPGTVVLLAAAAMLGVGTWLGRRRGGARMKKG
jgi:hypothetical protein